jgi:hypothetical protein
MRVAKPLNQCDGSASLVRIAGRVIEELLLRLRPAVPSLADLRVELPEGVVKKLPEGVVKKQPAGLSPIEADPSTASAAIRAAPICAPPGHEATSPAVPEDINGSVSGAAAGAPGSAPIQTPAQVHVLFAEGGFVKHPLLEDLSKDSLGESLLTFTACTKAEITKGEALFNCGLAGAPARPNNSRLADHSVK